MMPMELSRIRNFVIIAHVDHGKSTLADRFLELTRTVDKRIFQNQFLDQMDLERERGITIKMQPVRMAYRFPRTAHHTSQPGKGSPQPAMRDAPDLEYTLNLIDTPGHVDFSYEVSRSLAAVEGAILLVDVTQGIQAQTLANLHLAQQQGLCVIGAVNKIDLPHASESVAEIRAQLAKLVGQQEDDILLVSGKTGQGAEELLDAVIERIPPPDGNPAGIFRALVFDSIYDAYKGAIAFVRVIDGSLEKNATVRALAAGVQATAIEVGGFKPQLTPRARLEAGEIGYIATGLKNPDSIRVGDTITIVQSGAREDAIVALPGYREPQPVVFVSMYPTMADDIDTLSDALHKLRLNDASLHFTHERQEMLGQGFRIGCLGTLHLEIIKERLLREYGLEPILTAPSVKYEVVTKAGAVIEVFTPSDLPPTEQIQEIREPWVKGEIIAPARYVGALMGIIQAYRGIAGTVDTVSSQALLAHFEMPLADIIIDFYDAIKSATQGYASLSYDVARWQKGDVVKLDILVHGEKVDAFSRIVPRSKARAIGLATIERLKELLPREVFAVAVQAAIGSDIVARVTIPAMRKELGNFGKNGGDRTRKMKLWQNQKKGKKRAALLGTVDVPASVFFEVFKMTKNQ